MEMGEVAVTVGGGGQHQWGYRRFTLHWRLVEAAIMPIYARMHTHTHNTTQTDTPPHLLTFFAQSFAAWTTCFRVEVGEGEGAEAVGVAFLSTPNPPMSAMSSLNWTGCSVAHWSRAGCRMAGIIVLPNALKSLR